MQYFAMTVEEKNELCAKGFKCLGCHTIYEGKISLNKFKWEFDMPKQPKVEEKIVEPEKPTIENKVEPIPAKRRGNPNWFNKGKK